MKYLILCEGPNEEVIIDLLLYKNKLKIKRDELIGLRPYSIRQLSNPTIKSELKIYDQPVTVLRIGDTQKEKFNIPDDLKHIVSKERILKYCTKPELEILLIINEGLYKEFKKSSQNKAKSFAADKIIYNRRRYDNSCDFFLEYYGNGRLSILVESLIEYKRIKKHNKGELFLADLLR